jgi:excisionase family DNA binding protein
MSETVTLAEAAKQLRISTRTARRWIRAGALPAELGPGRNGPRYLVPVAAVEELREERAARAPAPDVAGAEPSGEALREAWRELTRTQQELWRASRDLARVADEMRRLREELAETRRAIRADRELRFATEAQRAQRRGENESRADARPGRDHNRDGASQH